ncbi:MAG TPA: long-chain-fatty-acid--CoA ligase, partial [Candidatus Limnocylindrales bacterium]|nr:long-chain-fatty-acid--CoA ligase [Candidatus Limnocylindrales bacterium]
MFVPLSVLEFRDRAATFFGDKVGVIDGDEQYTYRAFAERTHRLAGALVELGVEPGDRVSFITFNTHHLLEAYYGVIEAGAVLNPINIRLAPHEIEYILGHAASRVVFFHREFAPLVEAIAPRLDPRPVFVQLDGESDEAGEAGQAGQVGPLADHEYETLLAGSAPDARQLDIDENALAELFYTSGTTGLPKGVAMTHRELYLHSLAAQIGLGFTEDDIVLHVVPLFHVNGWGTPHFLTMVGGRHVMLRRFDPTALMSLVERHRVTRLLAVPTIFNAVLNSRERPRFDLSSLRQLIIGGSPASPDLVRALEAEIGVQAIVGYGLTETSPIITLAQPRRVLTDSEPEERRQERQAMTGWAIPGVRIRVVDGDGRDVRPDAEQIGEIVVRGNTVMDGYYLDPEATDVAIRDGWFHTGDMATIDDAGYILIKDRSKDVIISAGENISSVEIEVALAAHPAVLECAVVAAPDDKRGEVPVAIVVRKPDSEVSANDLRAFCRTRLAAHKVPRDIQFREALPKGGTGKILK